MNMLRGAKSQKPVREGDVFVYETKDGLKRYGRAMATGIPFNGMPCTGVGLIAVCLYAVTTTASDGSLLLPSQLLIPPTVTTQRMWSSGWFVTVHNRPVLSSEKLPVYQFWSTTTGSFFDLQGEKVNRQIGPIGSFTIAMEGAISIDISRALGWEYIKGHPADPVPSSLSDFYVLYKEKL